MKLKHASAWHLQSWQNCLTENGKIKTYHPTKFQVYEACILSTLLYSSETWNCNMSQENKLNTFYLRNTGRILGIKLQDKITNHEVLQRSRTFTIHCLLSNRRLRWLGHIKRMEPNRIPIDLLFSQLENGTRPLGRPHLRYTGVCKRDMKSTNIDIINWENLAVDRVRWRAVVKKGVGTAESNRRRDHELKRQQRKEAMHIPLGSGSTFQSRNWETMYSQNRPAQPPAEMLSKLNGILITYIHHQQWRKGGQHNI